MQNEEFDFDREKLSQKLLSEYLEEEDALSDDARERLKWLRVRRALLIAVGVLIVGFFIFAWQTDKFALTSSSVDSLPLVRADKTPIKIKPDDPGGIKVANMDKSIYSSIDENSDEEELPKVTRILPAPEEPVKRAEIALKPLKTEEIKAQFDTEGNKRDAKRDNAQVETKTTDYAAINKEQKSLTLEDMIGEALKDIEPEDIQPTPVPRRKSIVVPEENNTDNGPRLQLGAFRTHAEAEQQWKRISGLFSDSLADKKHYIEKADLGAKGVFYRLQVGSLNGSTQAREVCNELIEKKQGCFIVKQ